MRTAVIQILNSKQTSKLDMYKVKQHKNEVTVTSPSKLMNKELTIMVTFNL